MKYILLILLLLTSPVSKAEDGKELLLKMIEAMKSHQSISYKAAIKMKYFDREDIIQLKGDVQLSRAKDTILGGKVWFACDDTLYKFYDLKKIYVVDKKAREVTTYDAHKGEDWGMTGNTAYNVVWDDLLDSRGLEERITKPKDIKYLGDTLVNGIDCYMVLLQAPDMEEFTGRIRIYYLDKKNYTPLLFRGWVRYQGNYQFEERHLLSHTWDKVTERKFSAKQIPANYKTVVFKRDEEQDKLLDSGAVAPVIAGKHYQHDLQEETVVFNGKITVIDFWYMACHPCVLAIPEIEKLKEKYKGDPRVQIIGVNAYDSDTARIKKLPQFLEHNHIEYPIFLVERKLPDAYKIHGWPTFYIIDKDGKVTHTEIGFDDTLFSRLSEKIEELLK